MSAQVDLPIEHESAEVDIDYLCKSKRTVGAVVSYQSELGGYTPKQLYIPLQMQKSVWSGIVSDQRSFPIVGECDKYTQFRDLTGNDALLYWLAHISGYDPRSLRRYKSSVEEENERLRHELAEERKRLETIKEFMRETGK